MIKATNKHKKEVLKILDDFRDACHAIINPQEKFKSTTARDKGSDMFDKVVGSNNSEIFLAKENDQLIGIATVNKIPQVRYGRNITEIEEMFVYPEYQGKNVATALIDSMIERSRDNDIKVIRLESAHALKRAHGFYEKVGFQNYGQAFEINVN